MNVNEFIYKVCHSFQCGRPIPVGQQCLECGAEIGGIGYNIPAPGNEKLDDRLFCNNCSLTKLQCYTSPLYQLLVRLLY